MWFCLITESTCQRFWSPVILFLDAPITSKQWLLPTKAMQTGQPQYRVILVCKVLGHTRISFMCIRSQTKNYTKTRMKIQRSSWKYQMNDYTELTYQNATVTHHSKRTIQVSKMIKCKFTFWKDHHMCRSKMGMQVVIPK